MNASIKESEDKEKSISLLRINLLWKPFWVDFRNIRIVFGTIPRLTYLYSKKTRNVFNFKTFLVFKSTGMWATGWGEGLSSSVHLESPWAARLTRTPAFFRSIRVFIMCVLSMSVHWPGFVCLLVSCTNPALVAWYALSMPSTCTASRCDLDIQFDDHSWKAPFSFESTAFLRTSDHLHHSRLLCPSFAAALRWHRDLQKLTRAVPYASNFAQFSADQQGRSWGAIFWIQLDCGFGHRPTFAEKRFGVFSSSLSLVWQDLWLGLRARALLQEIAGEIWRRVILRWAHLSFQRTWRPLILGKTKSPPSLQIYSVAMPCSCSWQPWNSTKTRYQVYLKVTSLAFESWRVWIYRATKYRVWTLLHSRDWKSWRNCCCMKTWYEFFLPVCLRDLASWQAWG